MVSHPFVVPALPAETLALYTTYDASSLPPISRCDPHTAADAAQSENLVVAAAPKKLFGLLSGSLDDFRRYAGDEGTNWLLSMARGICCPRATGDDILWEHDRVSDSWQQVGTAEPLTASSYLYQPPKHAPICLTQISAGKDPDDVSYKHCGGTLREQLGARDKVCWISGLRAPLCAVHIFPETMDPPYIQRVLGDFFTPGEPALVGPVGGRWQDERLALLLTLSLEYYFSQFQLGFRRREARGVDQSSQDSNVYECHDFAEPDPDGSATVLTWAGQEELGLAKLPPLHGQPVAPPNPQGHNLPPEAAVRWHYVQCVVHKFAHADYRGVDGILLPAPPLCEDPPSCYEYGDPACECGGPTADDRQRQRWGPDHDSSASPVNDSGPLSSTP